MKLLSSSLQFIELLLAFAINPFVRSTLFSRPSFFPLLKSRVRMCLLGLKGYWLDGHFAEQLDAWETCFVVARPVFVNSKRHRSHLAHRSYRLEDAQSNGREFLQRGQVTFKIFLSRSVAIEGKSVPRTGALSCPTNSIYSGGDSIC